MTEEQKFLEEANRTGQWLFNETPTEESLWLPRSDWVLSDVNSGSGSGGRKPEGMRYKLWADQN